MYTKFDLQGLKVTYLQLLLDRPDGDVEGCILDAYLAHIDYLRAQRSEKE